MSDPAPDGDAPTLLERMVSAGLDETKARGHLDAGMVRVEGETITDPAAVVPRGQRWAIGPAN